LDGLALVRAEIVIEPPGRRDVPARVRGLSLDGDCVAFRFEQCSRLIEQTNRGTPKAYLKEMFSAVPVAVLVRIDVLCILDTVGELRVEERENSARLCFNIGSSRSCLP
jgi:hypothetical protein